MKVAVKTKNPTMKEQLDAIDEENQLLEKQMFGVNGQMTVDSRVAEVAALMQTNPLIIGPTLKWVRATIGRMNLAQLRELYSEEELEEMLKSVK
jgi:hypothetical protein